MTEAVLAETVNASQPAINRYRNAERFPNAEIAQRIHDATGGAVSFDTWRDEFMRKSGIGDAERKALIDRRKVTAA